MKLCPECGGEKVVLDIIWEAYESCDDCPQRDRECVPLGDDEYEPCIEMAVVICEECNGTGYVN